MIERGLSGHKYCRLKHFDGLGLIETCKVCLNKIRTKAAMKRHYMKVHQMEETDAKTLTWGTTGNPRVFATSEVESSGRPYLGLFISFFNLVFLIDFFFSGIYCV